MARTGLLRQRRARAAPISATRFMKKSSSVSRIGLSETSVAPRGGELRQQTIRRLVERQLERISAR